MVCSPLALAIATASLLAMLLVLDGADGQLRVTLSRTLLVFHLALGSLMLLLGFLPLFQLLF